MKEKEYYFVYGTLKSNHSNNYILKQSSTAKLIEEATTEPKYTMYNLGFFPGVINNGKTAIQGEIWEVSDEDTKKRLDRLEGYSGDNNPNNLYNKEVIKVNNKNVNIYILNKTSMLDDSNITDGKW